MAITACLYAVAWSGPSGPLIEMARNPADPSYFSVDGLFLVIQDEMDQQFAERPFGMPKGSNLLLKFQVDPALGYPREYRRDVSGGLKSLAIDVVRLNPEPPGEIPPLATGSP
jgi:hypothetical protein